MVRMNRSIQSFCSANTCSTRERIFDLALWARRMPSGMARPFGFLWCTRDRKPFFCMRRLRWRLTGGVRPHAACGIALCRKKPLAQLAALVSGGGGLQPNGAAHAIKIRPQRCTGPAIRRASTSTDRENAVVQLQAKLVFMAQRDRKLLRHRHQAAIEVRRVPILRRPASRRLPQGGARQF
jgi:hypothetical protein